MTDHKPLIYLFGTKKGIPEMATGRLQRWAVYLNSFDFEVQYIKGKDNTNVNGSSRLPIGKIRSDNSNSYSYLNFVVVNSEIPIVAKDIKDQTLKDPELVKILKFVTEGWPDSIGASNVEKKIIFYCLAF